MTNTWEAPVNSRRIIFGHQSVGRNLIDGLRCLDPSIPVFDATAGLPDRLKAGLYHMPLGKNRDVCSKFEAFSGVLSAAGAQTDIAMMKLCYVDIDRNSDAEQVFDAYQEMLQTLNRRHRGLCIAHITVPLRSISLGIRSQVKRLCGWPLANVEDNMSRESYNALLRARYQSQGRLFDLAAEEMLSPSGEICQIRYRNRDVPALSTAFTSDGGHLNEAGRRQLSRRFLQFIQAL